jgi:hypothetical protein
LNSSTATNDLTNPSLYWTDPRNYQIVSFRGKPPAGAAFAQFIIVLGGTFTAVPAKYLSVFKPFFGEIPNGAIGLPPWDPGVANPVGTDQVAENAMTEVGEYRNDAGAAITFANQISVMVSLANVTAQAAAWIQVTCTFECSARNLGSVPLDFRASLFQNVKYPVLNRHALTVPANSLGKSTVTLQATYRVAAGDVINPWVQFVRDYSLVGVGAVATPEDRIYNIVSRIEIVKR